MTEVAGRPGVDTWRDARPSRPMLHVDVERRPADGQDSEFVRGLFADSRDELLLLTPDTRDLIIDMQFRAQRRAWRLDHPNARHEVLLVRGVRAGHLLVDHVGDTVHIVDIAVRSGLRGLGIGSELLGSFAADADRTRRILRLRVWGGNHGARRFFERCGFGVSGVVAGYHELYRPPAG